MSDILWVAIMRSEIRSPTTEALSPILLSHLPRRHPHRHEACITNHPIGNERMNRIVGEEIRLWVLLTPIDEDFVLCSCEHGIAHCRCNRAYHLVGSERFPAGCAADQVRTGDQPQDRQSDASSSCANVHMGR